MRGGHLNFPLANLGGTTSEYEILEDGEGLIT